MVETINYGLARLWTWYLERKAGRPKMSKNLSAGGRRSETRLCDRLVFFLLFWELSRHTELGTTGGPSPVPSHPHICGDWEHVTSVVPSHPQMCGDWERVNHLSHWPIS